VRPAARRSLIFGVTLGTGLLLVHLLQDEPLPDRVESYGDAEPLGSGALVFRKPDEALDVTVQAAEADFDIHASWKNEAGEVKRVPAYRVHILDVRRATDGSITVKRPRLTALDLETGAERGTLQALDGRIEDDQGLLEHLGLSPGGMSIDRFSLLGEVRGDFALEDGTRALVETDELIVDGPLVRSPGLVTWTHEEAVLSGVEMSYDRDAGRLELSRDVQMQVLGTLPSQRIRLRSPTGLEWQAPPDTEGRGQVFLRGPVTGEAEDGSTLEADRVFLDDATLAITLEGSANVRRVTTAGVETVAAETLTVRRTEGAAYELTRASGGVRITREEGAESTWLETEQLDGSGSELVATGPARLGTRDVEIATVGLRLDTGRSRLQLMRDVEMTGVDGPGSPFAGGWLKAPEGLVLEGRAGSRTLTISGRVSAALPGSGTVASGQLRWDERAHELYLSQAVALTMVLSTGERSLHAGDVRLSLDEPFAVTALDARDQVLIEQPDGVGGIMGLSGAHVVASTGRLLAPEDFSLHWRGIESHGQGLDLDEEQHHISIAREAFIERQVEGGRERVEARGGLSWWMPEERGAELMQGRGELRGPVRLERADGTSLGADLVRFEGGVGSVELLGSAVLEQAGVGNLASDELRMTGLPGARTIRSHEHVTWTFGEISGSGTGFQVDEALGRARFEQAVEFRWLDPITGLTRRLECDGAFQWTSPPGAIDVLRQGRAELRDNVRGWDGMGGGLQADRLVMDMSLFVAELFGECAVQRVRDGQLHTLTTGDEGYIRIQTDPALQPMHFQARGRADLTVGSMRLVADTLDWDLTQDHVVAAGDCRLLFDGYWTNVPRIEAWPEAMRWVVPHAVSVGGPR